MKKVLLVLIITLLAMTGCSSKNVNNTTNPENKVSELENKFTYVTGKVLKDNTLVEYTTLNRGDKVTIVDEDDKFVYVDVDNLVLAINGDYLRKASDAEFEGYDGFTRGGVGLYSDFDLTDKIETFSLNSNVKVIDSFAGVLLVEVDGVQGYMDGKAVSATKIPVYVAPKVETPAEQSTPSYSAPSYSAPSYTPEKDGQDIPTPAPTPAPAPSQSSGNDGQDIQLGFSYQGGPEAVYLEGDKEATVLADGTVAYITSLNRGDEVKVVEEGEEYHKVLVGARIGTIKAVFVRLGDELYLPWDGYTRGGSGIYEDYELTERIKSYSVNTSIKVVDEVGDRFVVELEDGQIGYMLKTNISESKYYVAPVVTAPVETPAPTYNPTPSAPAPAPAPAPTPAPAPEWTPDFD